MGGGIGGRYDGGMQLQNVIIKLLFDNIFVDGRRTGLKITNILKDSAIGEESSLNVNLLFNDNTELRATLSNEQQILELREIVGKILSPQESRAADAVMTNSFAATSSQ